MSQYRIPWRLNLTIVAAQLATAIVIFWLASITTAWWQLALLCLSFAIVGNSIYATLHEAEHGMLVPWRRVNDALGVVLALFFPAPFHLLRQGHLGHHLRNRSDDEAFDYYFAGDNPVWKWMQLYGILTGLFWVTIVFSNLVILFVPTVLKRQRFQFDRPSAALLDSLNPRYWRAIRLEAAAVLVFHAFVIWSLQIPLVAYAVVYAGFGIVWSAMQYVHHFGTERDVVHGSRNLWLCPPIDLAWLNHNWHHAHHQHPTVPWVYLPELARQKNAKREFLIWHYFRMWRGPRFTDKSVENRYVGRVIQ